MSTTRRQQRPHTLDVTCPEHTEPPPSASFTLPRSDDPLCGWMRLAAEAILRDPARYQLLSEVAAELMHHAQAFQDALMLAIDPATRTPETISAKNDAREAARTAFKPIIDHIRHHAEIDIADKIALGMKQTPRRSRTPIEPPNTAPLINITNAGADGTHTLHYADERTPTKRRRPKGAGYLDLRIIAAPMHPPGNTAGIWPNPDSTAEALAAAGAFMRSERISKSPFTIQHDRAHAGWCATYHARWCTNTNKPGRWSHMPASMIIAFGGPVQPPSEQPPE